LLQLAGVGEAWLSNNISGGQSSLDTAVTTTLNQIAGNLIGTLSSKSLSTLSSLLIADAGQKLGLSGFVGQVFTTTGNTISTQLAQNVVDAVRQGIALDSTQLLIGMNWQNILNGVGSALGNRIGSEIGNGLLTPGSVAQQLFNLVGGTYLSTLGGDIGSAVSDALS
jgi:hypothetical protein